MEYVSVFEGQQVKTCQKGLNVYVLRESQDEHLFNLL